MQGYAGQAVRSIFSTKEDQGAQKGKAGAKNPAKRPFFCRQEPAPSPFEIGLPGLHYVI